MLHTHVRFARRVGVAPGTTTLKFDGARTGPALGPQGRGHYHQVLGGPPIPPGPFYYATQARLTQARWEPDPNTDNIKIAIPPNQWVTGPMTMKISMPAAQRAMGPVPNDGQVATMHNYLPVRKGWIEPASGETIYTLQGPMGAEASKVETWAITASVISALALATTTVLAIMRYKSGK